MISFKNKKILITGATGGIGGELIRKFSDLGGNIVATGTKSEKLDAIKKNYPNIKIQKFDARALKFVIKLSNYYKLCKKTRNFTHARK